MTTVLIIAASFAAGCIVTYLFLRAAADLDRRINRIISDNANDWWI